MKTNYKNYYHDYPIYQSLVGLQVNSFGYDHICSEYTTSMKVKLAKICN